MLNGALTPGASNPDAARRVRPVAMALTLRSENVAIPATAETLVVPPSDVLPWPRRVTATVAVETVTVLPSESWTATRGAGVSAKPTTHALGHGCPTNVSRLAAPAVTLKGALVAPVSPVALAARR